MTLYDHLAEVHGTKLPPDTSIIQMEALHAEEHTRATGTWARGGSVGFDDHHHDLSLPDVHGDVLEGHLHNTHRDRPDGSWGPEEWEEMHLHAHQGGAENIYMPHTHRDMPLHPYPIEQLRDHCHFTHLDPEEPYDDRVIEHHDRLHAMNKIGVPHAHLLQGTHLLDEPINFEQFTTHSGAVVGDPLPGPVHVEDSGAELPDEIEPVNRRLVLIAAAEFEGLIAVRRQMMAVTETIQEAQRKAQRLLAQSDQHFRVLERLAIHPKHYEHLLAPGEVEWAHGMNSGGGVSLYEAVEYVVHAAADRALGRVTMGTNQPPAQGEHHHPDLRHDQAVSDDFDPEDDKSPGSKGP